MTELSPLPTQPTAETTAESDLSGRRLGDYQLLRRLGRGGMADVYLAEQSSLRRQVAFKVLKSHLARDEMYVKRFHNEAQAAAALVHANIVQIYEVGCLDGVHFIAQEYVQGQNLRELLVRNGPPDVKLALRIMRQVAAALLRAYERGIVHRDIKPENILLTREGDVKVADFGLARVTRDGAASNLTQENTTLGTPLYMSPEQVEGRTVDHRSDIYSLGVTCYHMLSGAPPFRGETALSIAVQHVKTQPRPLETLRPDLPPRLCAIVHRSLEKDPVRRYASARELLRDLRSVQAEIGDTDGTNDDFWSDLGVALEGRSAGTQRLDELMKSASMQVRDDRRGYLLLLALGFVLALVVGGAIALSLRRGPLIVERSPSLQDIPKMPSARQQYGYAMFFPNSEKHLLAVAYYFPNDPFYVRISKKDLALLYLRENKLSAAADLFNEFANLSDVEGEFRAFGLAGQGVVLSLRGQHTEALQKLEESRRTGVRLESPMRELAFQAAQSSFRRLNSASKAEWESWMRDAFGEGT